MINTAIFVHVVALGNDVRLSARLFGIVFCSCSLASHLSAQRLVAPETLAELRAASDPRLSPKGDTVAYVVSQPDLKQNRRRSEIWVAPVDGLGEPRRLTDPSWSSTSPQWSPDGHTLAFLSTRAPIRSAEESRDSDQVTSKPNSEIYLLSLNGGEAQRLTNLRNGVTSFNWSPDGTRLVFVSSSGPPDLLKPGEASDSRHYVHSTYKYDGRGFFDGRRQHLWVVTVASGEAKQITDGDWDDTDPQWSPDCSHIAFYSNRTGTYWDDISASLLGVWVTPSAGGTPVRLASDAIPAGPSAWSPDGSSIAYFGADRELAPPRLMLVYIGNTKPRVLASDVDLSVRELQWAENGQVLYFLGNIRGNNQIFRIDIATARLTQITSGERWIHDARIRKDSNTILFSAGDFEHPPELFVARLDDSGEKRLSHLNDSVLGSLKVQPFERFSFKATDGTDLHGFLVKPVGFDAHKKYPMILYIHGGPQRMFGADWMMPVQVFAANGWAVLFMNPRGSTGYGSRFSTEIIQKEWGGKVYTDLMSGVDEELAKNGWIDPDRLGVTGCSFGGFMTNWIVSHTTRFKAAVPMCSISNYISDEGTRDDYYGHANDFGGDLYQNFELYWKYSPVRYAMNVKTPTLILHGEADERVPIEQAEQWFRALRHFHVPAELVIFPREFHNGLLGGEPKHVVEVMNWQVYWFKKYLNSDLNAVAPDRLPSTKQNSVAAAQ